MAENILVLDLETKSLFSDHADRRCESLGVSVVGTYCYRAGEYRIYEENEISELAGRLAEKPLLVGFNIRRFDMPCLGPYLQFDPGALPMCDMLEIIHEILGHRVSLESVAQATLGTGKSGSGLDAVEYFRTGQMDKLKKYCLDDVRVTKDVFEYGAEHSEIFYTRKFDKTKGRVPVSWKVQHPDQEAGETQMGLF